MIKDLEKMISNYFQFVKAEEIIFFCKENKVFKFIEDISNEKDFEGKIGHLEDEVEELEDEVKDLEKRIATLEKRNKILLKKYKEITKLWEKH